MAKQATKQIFETATATKATAADLRRVAKRMTGVFRNIQLDTKLASSVNVGPRQWVFVMTKDAASRWAEMQDGSMVLGVLHYHVPAKEESQPSRMLVATFDKGGKIKLQMIDASGQVLWTGTGKFNRSKELEFEMPITRPNSEHVGVMAGRLTQKGELTFTESRLPRPIKKNAPKLVSEQ